MKACIWKKQRIYYIMYWTKYDWTKTNYERYILIQSKDIPTFFSRESHLASSDRIIYKQEEPIIQNKLTLHKF